MNSPIERPQNITPEANLIPFAADPIISFFLRRKAIWTPVIFVAFFALAGLASYFDGTFFEISRETHSYPEHALLASYTDEKFGFWFVVVFFSVLVLYARHLSKQIVRSFHLLYKRDIFDEKQNPKADAIKKLQEHFDRRRAYIGSAFMGIWFVVLWIMGRLGYFDENLGVIPLYTARDSYFAFAWILLFSVVGSHLFMSVIWRIIVCSYMLHDRFKDKTTVQLQPLHPDRCCGLRFVGDLTLLMSGFAIFYPLFLAMLSFTYPQFLATPALQIGLIYSGAVLYILGGSFIFLYPTLSAHALMTEEREEAMHTLNKRFFSLYESVFRKLEDERVEARDMEEQINLLNNIREYYREVERRAIWPFDLKIISEFIGLIGIPLLLVFAEHIVPLFL
jgi:hypothetical protein